MDLSQPITIGTIPAEQPQAGEIWVLRWAPLVDLAVGEERPGCSGEWHQGNVVEGEICRYVMIVNEFQISEELEETEPFITVMLFSDKTDCISQVDILLPATLSGLPGDYLCETWHVFPLHRANLSHPTGQRVSRQMYDLLLTLGDAYYGLTNDIPSLQEIQQLGLSASIVAASNPEVQQFHHREKAWSTMLSPSFVANRLEQQKLQFVEAVLAEAQQMEQEWAELQNPLSDLMFPPGSQTLISLGQWLQDGVEFGWQTVAHFLDVQKMSFGVALRQSDPLPAPLIDAKYIQTLLEQLVKTQDEPQCRRVLKRLGDVATGNAAAIQSIAALLPRTQDDETLWTAVESLSRLDPDHPVSVSRTKRVDLERQAVGPSVQLVVSLFQKASQQMSVLLRVYPMGYEFFLPADLRLILLDSAGQVLREAQARPSDVLMQLKLSGYPGEQFGVQVALHDTCMTEHFII